MIYISYLKMAIHSQLQYKLSFVMASISHFFITIVEFASLYFLFQRFPQIEGWSLYEVMFFYGTVHIAFALAEMWVRAFDNFDKYMREGHFDRIILRPVNVFVQILGSEFQLLRIGRMAAGLFALCLGINHLEIAMNGYKIGLIIYAILGGMFMFSALFVVQATVCFFTIDALEVFNAFTYGGVEMAQYPMNIYKEWFRNIFLYLVPVGGVTYFTLLVVLEKTTHPVIGWLFPLCGVICFLLAATVFKYVGMRHYQSTGS